MKEAHGGTVDKLARELNLKKDSIIDFSANINPLGLSKGARAAIENGIDSIKDYPDDESIELIEALAKYHHLPTENLLVGNGSIEFIYLIARILRDKKVLIVVPAFSEYERALTIAGANIEFFSLGEADGFKVDSKKLAARLAEGFDALWMANPTNPNGRLLSESATKKLLTMTRELGVLSIIDEAFMDFVEEDSIKSQLLDNSHLIVLRSMTKFFALAGLRVGYIFAEKNMIEKIKEIKEPWTLNRLGSLAAVASLREETYIEDTRNFIKTEYDFLYAGLGSIANIKPYTSKANFILIELTGSIKAEEVQKKLLADYNIFIRDCTNYRGLEGEHIRVAIKKRADNMMLLTALNDALK